MISEIIGWGDQGSFSAPESAIDFPGYLFVESLSVIRLLTSNIQ